MERLTEWTGERWIARQERLPDGTVVGDKMVYAKLAAFEDAQEQGRLFIGKFPTQTTVYPADDGKIFMGEVIGYGAENSICVICYGMILKGKRIQLRETFECWYDPDYVYSNPEEAEAALKEID